MMEAFDLYEKYPFESPDGFINRRFGLDATGQSETYFEAIVNMSVGELAEFLSLSMACDACPIRQCDAMDGDCESCIEGWLNKRIP